MQIKFIRFIPHLFTLGNLLLGCLGIVFCFSDRIMPVQLDELDVTGKNIGVIFGYSNRLYLSSFMIFGALVLDYLDGFLARLLKVPSALGVQLDSLADAVTFGVLPACIYYQLLHAAWQLQPNALFVPLIFLIPAFLIALAAVYRLAKFNVDDRQRDSFIGLATPAMAMFAAALPLIFFTNALGLSAFILNKWVLYLLIVTFSWLMVAEIPMFSFKTKGLKWKGNEMQMVFLVLAVLLILMLKYAGIAGSVLLYIFICLFQHFISSKRSI